MSQLIDFANSLLKGANSKKSDDVCLANAMEIISSSGLNTDTISKSADMEIGQMFITSDEEKKIMEKQVLIADLFCKDAAKFAKSLGNADPEILSGLRDVGMDSANKAAVRSKNPSAGRGL